MDFAKGLADSLKRLRTDAGLTQTQMARRLGVSQPTLYRLENGDQNTTLKTLAQICRVLRCDVGELLRGEAKARQTGRRLRR